MRSQMRDGSRLWDYQVLEQLGKGEYGQVFKVKNKKDGQFYALKRVNIASCHVSPSLLSKKRKSKHLDK